MALKENLPAMKDTVGSSGSSFILKAQLGLIAMSYSVCTTCFRLTDLTKQSSQRCLCPTEVHVERNGVDCPTGFHLCDLCARAEAGGTGRFSWNACKCCLSVNANTQKRLGFSLPLGRHSIMNGFSVPVSAVGDELAAGADALVAFIAKSVAISDWGLLQARELFESVPEWAKEDHIPLEIWEKKFKASKEKSLVALQNYYGVKKLTDLLKKVK